MVPWKGKRPKNKANRIAVQCIFVLLPTGIHDSSFLWSRLWPFIRWMSISYKKWCEVVVSDHFTSEMTDIFSCARMHAHTHTHTQVHTQWHTLCMEVLSRHLETFVVVGRVPSIPGRISWYYSSGFRKWTRTHNCVQMCKFLRAPAFVSNEVIIIKFAGTFRLRTLLCKYPVL